MTKNHFISFGNNVRIVSNAITEKMGLAGLTGQVHGETTPSITSVEVIGEVKADYAVNVFFEERGEGYWFAPELLEFIDYAAGTEITLEGVAKKWTRASTGEWIVSESAESRERKPWWKVW